MKNSKNEFMDDKKACNEACIVRMLLLRFLCLLIIIENTAFFIAGHIIYPHNETWLLLSLFLVFISAECLILLFSFGFQPHKNAENDNNGNGNSNNDV